MWTMPPSAITLPQNDGSVTVSVDTTLTASGNTRAINGIVKNAIAGTGWTDVEGTQGETGIPIDSTGSGQSLNDYKRVMFPVYAGYPLWVGDTQVTSANKNDVLGNGRIAYTPAKDATPATLTLKRATVIGRHDFVDVNENDCAAAIYAEGNLTVDVKADSRVTGPDVSGGAKRMSYGVYVKGGSLTVQGDGKLTAAGGATNQSFSRGIFADVVTIAGTVIARGGEGDYSSGVEASGDVTVDGALTANGGVGNDVARSAGVSTNGNKMTAVSRSA